MIAALLFSAQPRLFAMNGCSQFVNCPTLAMRQSLGYGRSTTVSCTSTMAIQLALRHPSASLPNSIGNTPKMRLTACTRQVNAQPTMHFRFTVVAHGITCVIGGPKRTPQHCAIYLVLFCRYGSVSALTSVHGLTRQFQISPALVQQVETSVTLIPHVSNSTHMDTPSTELASCLTKVQLALSASGSPLGCHSCHASIPPTPSLHASHIRRNLASRESTLVCQLGWTPSVAFRSTFFAHMLSACVLTTRKLSASQAQEELAMTATGAQTNRFCSTLAQCASSLFHSLLGPFTPRHFVFSFRSRNRTLGIPQNPTTFFPTLATPLFLTPFSMHWNLHI